MRYPFIRSAKVLVALLVVFAITIAFVSSTQIVAAANSIVSSLNPSTYGQSVTFTWSTDAFCGANKPKASKALSVDFYDGNTLLASVPATQVGQCGFTASFTTATLSIGTHHIIADDGDVRVALDQVVNGPRDVPEGDTLLLLGGGMSGMGVWLRYQWNKRRKK